MGLIRFPQGLLWPSFNINFGASGPQSIGATALNAAGMKLAMIGRLYIDGRAASKTLNTSGSSAIRFRLGTTTWANGSSSIDIGIQGVANGAGPTAQPDGTFTVKATIAGGAGLTGSAYNTVVPTTGSATLNHGDPIAVVFDLTARAGLDSVVINCGSGVAGNDPVVNQHNGTSWASSGQSNTPQVTIVFNDGTLGTIDFTVPANGQVESGYASGTNPNERGNVFQVPFDCEIDALFAQLLLTDANSDYSLKLYSDPFGTPTALQTITKLAEHAGGSGNQRYRWGVLATPQALTRNTDYAITALATGSTNLQQILLTFGAAADRAFLQGGTTLQKITRNGSSGAFTAAGTTLVYDAGVRICSAYDTGGSGVTGVIGG